VKSKAVNIGVKLSEIVSGKGGFPDLSGLEIFDSSRKLTSPPKKARRIQIKGYLKDRANTYFLCTCIDRHGSALAQKEGSKTISYENVLIEHMSIMTKMSSCDFFFFAPLDVDTVTESCIGGGEVLKESPMNTDDAMSDTENRQQYGKGEEDLETDVEEEGKDMICEGVA
jgi:hypothetical protein